MTLRSKCAFFMIITNYEETLKLGKDWKKFENTHKNLLGEMRSLYTIANPENYHENRFLNLNRVACSLSPL